MFTKDLEELKSKETEMNNTLEGINSRITDVEKQMLPGGQNGGNHCCRTKSRKQKDWEIDENRLRDIWDNIKHTNIHIKGSHQEKRKIKDLIKYLKK